MKRIYRLKKTAQNDFTRLTGIEAIPLLSDKPVNCLISTQKTVQGGISIQRVAYSHYHNISTSLISVTPSCGIYNCVLKEHLIATYKPNKEDQQYIKSKRTMYTTDGLADILKIPKELLIPYLARI